MSCFEFVEVCVAACLCRLLFYGAYVALNHLALPMRRLMRFGACVAPDFCTAPLWRQVQYMTVGRRLCGVRYVSVPLRHQIIEYS